MEEQPYTDWLLENLAVGERIRLRAGVTSIGRHKASNIVSKSNYVSRYHAEIIVSKDDQTMQIRDLNSGNGIFINNELHRQTLHQLSDGDRIGIGVLIIDDSDIDLNHLVFRVQHAPLRPFRAAIEKTPKEATSSYSDISKSYSSINRDDIPCTSGTSKEVSNKLCPSQNEKTIENEIMEDNTKPAELTYPQEEVIILIDSDEENDNCAKEPTLSKQNDFILPKIVAVAGNIDTLTSNAEASCLTNVAPLTTTHHDNNNDQINTNTSDTKAKNCELHVPIVSSIKQEHELCISANINSILGGMKNINLVSAPVARPLVDGDCVSILTSDEDEDQDVRTGSCEILHLNAEKNISERLQARQQNKSPNLFENSINSSKEIEEMDIESNLNIKKYIEDDGDADDDYNSYDPQSDDEDVEDLMFSQVIINDMRDELANNKDDDDKIVSIKPLTDVHIKSEPTAEPLIAISTPLKQELHTSICWEDSDDEDFDEELETKVSDWSYKICSHSLSQPRMSMSQVYELKDEENSDVCETDDEEDNLTAFYNSQIDSIRVDEIASVLVEPVKNKLTNIDAKTDTVLQIDNDQTSTVPPVTSKSFSVTDSPLIRYSFGRTRRVVSSSSEEEEVVDNMLKKVQMRDLTKGRIKHISETETKHSKDRRMSCTSEQSSATVTSVSEAEAKNSKDETKLSVCERVEKSYPAVKASVSKSETAKHSNKRRQSSVSEERFAVVIPEKQVASKPSRKIFQQEEELSTKQRNPPLVIDAPQLPKYKGKLRGVSAVPRPPHSTSTSVGLLVHKHAETKERMKHESIANDLKRKWLEKPSESKRTKLKEIQDIRESRKERLKELADKQSKNKEEGSHNQKNTTDNLQSMKKPKVKLTTENRGTFLAKDIESDYKIPKIDKSKSANNLNSKWDTPQNSLNTIRSNTSHIDDNPFQSTIVSSTTNFDSKTTTTSAALCGGKPSKVNRSVSADYVETFSQQISKPDQLLLQHHHSTSSSALPNPIRAQRVKNKMTFASMEKNFVESHQNREKLAQISSKRSCLSSSQTEMGPSNKTDKRPKKTVRFNDTPIVHYIERVIGANKKVDVKDIMPLSTYNGRRQEVREKYAIVDRTNEIITQILKWSNEWLRNQNAQANAARETVLPMPNSFSSFANYQSTMFALMKLEYCSLLERDYNVNKSRSSYKVSLEYATETLDRVTLITKSNIKNKNNVPKWDLVVLNFGDRTPSTFAYMATHRKGAGNYTIVFEILTKMYSKEYLKSVKELNVWLALENVRVEFGVLNAVYQLENTPLFNEILNPSKLLESNPPSTCTTVRSKACDPLNEEQKSVMIETYTKTLEENTPNITLIQGPPGTGKSRVITNLALQLTYGNEVRFRDRKILICAQSNGAVDIITEKLYKISRRMQPSSMFNLVRFGMLNRINSNVLAVSLQKYIERHQMKKLKSIDHNIQVEDKENLKREMEQLEKQIAYMKLQNIEGTAQEDELIRSKKSLQIMRYLVNGSILPEDDFYLKKWYLSNAQIVCTTLSSCVNLSQYINYFDVCIIDEATQCTEPWTLLPLKFGMKSLVLVGDTQQLPATVLSKKAAELGLGTSLFTRIQRCLGAAATNSTIVDNQFNKNIFSLQTQYRMHPEICKWPNSYFYKSKLINAASTVQHATCIMPFSILNLTYTQNDNCSNGQIVNNLEAEFVAKLLKSLNKFIPMESNTYGIITPYMQHRNALSVSLRTAGLENIMVHTIDSYQGIEKDVIILSNARTTGIGFLYNSQRLNVALTRSRKCLILCGNFKNLESVPAWSSLLRSARQRKLFHEISANCVDDMEQNVIDKIRVER